MTVTTTAKKKTYTGDGVTVAFPTTFQFFDESEVVVTERVIATGAETVQTLTTHYTVSGGSGATGTVTAVTAPAATVQWVLSRSTAQTQGTDYTANDPFPADSHEDALDRLTLMVQDGQEKIDRALVFPVSDSTSISTEIPNSVDRASKLQGYDATGAPTVYAQASISDTIVPTAYMETLLDDANAAAAQTTLELVIGTNVLAPTGSALSLTNQQEIIIIACSDETTALAAGTAEVTFRMPYAMTLTGVRASLTTAQASGNIFTVDINDGGTTVLSTKLTIDNTEETSTTATTAAVISDSALADDAEITIDIDQIGDGTAKGLKVTLIGNRA